MSDVYYNPEKFDLETVAELDLSEPCYSFDLLVVWKSTRDGRFYYGTDSGCSCPSPFEGQGFSDLCDFTWADIEREIADGSGVVFTEAAAFRETLRRAGA